MLDVAINSISEKFRLLSQHNETFSFLYNIQKLKSESKEHTLNLCERLQIALTDGDDCDVDAVDLCDEILATIQIISPKEVTPFQILQYFYKYNLTENFPNLTIVFRILLTMPVTVASGGRSFSKLKLIKNYLRATMTQDRLVGLAFMAIEQEICNGLDYTDIIDMFARKKCRKVKFV